MTTSIMQGGDVKLVTSYSSCIWPAAHAKQDMETDKRRSWSSHFLLKWPPSPPFGCWNKSFTFSVLYGIEKTSECWFLHKSEIEFVSFVVEHFHQFRDDIIGIKKITDHWSQNLGQQWNLPNQFFCRNFWNNNTYRVRTLYQKHISRPQNFFSRTGHSH